MTGEIACLLEQRGEWYALLDLDFLGWAAGGTGDRAGEFGLMLHHLAAVAANYRGGGHCHALRQVGPPEPEPTSRATSSRST